MFIVSSNEVSGDVPGSQSVEIAILTPGIAQRLDRWLVDGVKGARQETATVPAFATASAPSLSRYSRWSADSAP